MASPSQEKLEEWHGELPNNVRDDVLERHCDRETAILTPAFRKYLLGREYEKPNTASQTRFRLKNRLQNALLDAELLTAPTARDILWEVINEGAEGGDGVRDEKGVTYNPAADPTLSSAVSDLFGVLFDALYTQETGAEPFQDYARIGVEKMWYTESLEDGEYPDVRLDVFFEEGENGLYPLEEVKRRFEAGTLLSQRPLRALVQAGEIPPEAPGEYRENLSEGKRRKMRLVDSNPGFSTLVHPEDVPDPGRLADGLSEDLPDPGELQQSRDEQQPDEGEMARDTVGWLFGGGGVGTELDREEFIREIRRAWPDEANPEPQP